MNILSSRPLLTAVVLAALLGLGACGKKNDGAAANNDSTMNSTSSDSSVSAKADDAASTAGAKVEDGVITTKVKSALLADATVKGLDINVDTMAGNVKLSGTVDNPAQIDTATQIAKGVEGVKNVDNQLKSK